MTTLAKPSGPAIRLEGVTKDFGRGRGVFNLNLAVGRGEILGFIGPNGAGKTTTMRMLLDLVRPTSGVLQVLGLEPRRDGLRLRKQVGYLPGDLQLPINRTGQAVLQELADLRGGDVPLLGNLVHRLHADLKTRIGRLSKGNRQKIGVIQALMHDPQVAILDEPTDGLDPLLRREVHRILAEARQRGRTIFLSSHVIHEVEQVCDRIALIRRGRLIGVSTVAALRASLRQTLLIRFTQPIDMKRLRVPGVRSCQVRGQWIEVELAGPPTALLQQLSQLPVAQIQGRSQELEDTILHVYQEDGHV